jgi:hypothetical protein
MSDEGSDRFRDVLGLLISLQVQRQPTLGGNVRPHPVDGLLHLAVAAKVARRRTRAVNMASERRKEDSSKVSTRSSS